MKNTLLLFSISIITSCTQRLEPTTEHINSIFQSKDFTIEFIIGTDATESMSFIEDLIVYKSTAGVMRKSISYDEALLINNFIQSQFRLHKGSRSKTPAIIILNTAKKVTLKIPDYKIDYLHLIHKLDLSYVPIKKK
jgi:hypothetical protein